MSRHLSGPLLAGYGPKHNRTSSSASTFRERKDDIVECLTVSAAGKVYSYCED